MQMQMQMQQSLTPKGVRDDSVCGFLVTLVWRRLIDAGLVDYLVGVVVAKARLIRVCCSTSWAPPLPVAGLALGLRFTLRTGLPRATLSRRGCMKARAPMLAGSSWTQTMSLADLWRASLCG